MDKKLKELTRLWCQWNKKEIDGDEFAYRVGQLYQEETLQTWNDPLEALLVKA